MMIILLQERALIFLSKVSGMSKAFVLVLFVVASVNADDIEIYRGKNTANISDLLASPTVTVNPFNPVEFSDDVYFSLFKPNKNTAWSGDIKKYKIALASDGQAIVVGREGESAVGDGGFFNNNATSYWSSPELQNEVSNKATALNSRKLYINLDSFSHKPTLLSKDNFITTLRDNLLDDLTEVDDSSISGIIDKDTLLIQGLLVSESGEMLPNLGQNTNTNLVTNTDDLVTWLLGLNSVGGLDGLGNKAHEQRASQHNFFGDSLHSSPVVANFGSLNFPNEVVILVTNQGLLHALDGSTGKELWAYMPDKSLLPNLGAYFNSENSGNHRYGLDGELSLDLQRDRNGKITKATVYLGQRRGGSKYFAIDITNATQDKPNLAPIRHVWTIQKLPRMGQSWAKPVSAVVNYCESENSCANTEVLFISGGYDTQYDDLLAPSNSSDAQAKSLASLAGNVVGNALYMVRRANGELLWMAGQNTNQVDANVAYLTNKNMLHSFPSEPTLIDANFDGIIDFFFAVDIAGQVWRFDFSGDVNVLNSNSKSTESVLIKIDGNDIVRGDNNLSRETAGGVIATLSDQADNRRFYNRLDVSLSPRTRNDLSKFNIVTGSGYRAHPLTSEVSNNRLYFLYDRHVLNPKFNIDSNGRPHKVSYDYAKNNKIKATDLGEKKNDSAFDTRVGVGAHYHGFYVDLSAGGSEKVLSASLTDGGAVFAVSYSPEISATDCVSNDCLTSLGASFLYQISLKTGDYNHFQLNKAGINAKPMIIELPANVIAKEADIKESPESRKVLIVGSEVFAEKIRTASKNSNISALCNPALEVCLTPSVIGEINKLNWWEHKN